ncbi:MAG: HAMP domain-containing sensor histidine kinase, partial [Proteobacteria bacterium]|nr:HAMP domain-containing sensor histidine kinase [Pseudomonadota bacterium]
KFAQDEQSHLTLSIIAMVNFILPIFICAQYGEAIENQFFYIKICAAIFFFPIFTIKYSNIKINSIVYGLYIHFVIFIILSLLPFYILLAHQQNIVWALSAVFSIFLLLLTIHTRYFVIFSILGFFSAYFYLFNIDSREEILHTSSHKTIAILLYVIIPLLLTKVFLMLKKDAHYQKHAQQMQVFSGAIAHEVNAPIAATKTLAMTLLDIANEIIESKENHYISSDNMRHNIIMNDEDFKMFVEILPKDLLYTANEAQKIIHMLLLLLRHEAIEKKEQHSMLTTVTEILDSGLFDNNRIHFRQENDFEFKGPKQHIKQIIQNLISNGLKHGGDNAQITIWISSNTLYVKDNGIGIDPKHIKYIFKPFYTSSKSGTGIGLALCNIIAINLGGRIRCTSKFGEYTEFALSLPHC